MKLQKPHHLSISDKIPNIFAFLEKLESLKNTDDMRGNPLIANGLEKAREKLLDYYPLNDDWIASNKMLYLAIVLDSRYNLSIFQHVDFSAEMIQSIINLFFQVYHEYKKEYKHELVEVVVDPGCSFPERPARSEFHYIRRADERIEDRFERYLNESRADENIDGITFFRLHKSRFPIISRKAIDYFAVLSMSAPAEALFSRTGNILTKKRGRLSSRTIKMLAILKSRGIITAEEMPDDNLDYEEHGNLTQLDGCGTTELIQPKLPTFWKGQMILG